MNKGSILEIATRTENINKPLTMEQGRIYENQLEEECNCICHREGIDVIHQEPCCEKYEPILNKDD